MKLQYLSLFCLAVAGFTLCSSSHVLNSELANPTYLNSIETDVVQTAEDLKAKLVEEAKVTHAVTRNYIAAQLKSNLYKALRVMAEKELEKMPSTFERQEEEEERERERERERPERERPDERERERERERPNRRPQQGQQQQQQQAGGNEAEAEEEEEEKTTRRPAGMVLPQVVNIFKAIFGGNINLTAYVEDASKLLPKPIGNQLVGIVKLLANNPGPKYTTASTASTSELTTEAPTTVVIKRSAGSNKTTTKKARVPKVTTTTPVTTTKEDDEEEEAQRVGAAARQIRIPGLDILGNIGAAVGNILNSNNNRNTESETKKPKTTAAPEEEGEDVTKKASSGSKQNSGTSSSSSGSNGNNNFDVGNFAKEVQNNIGQLVKIMPDLFKGAQEAFKLLSVVQNIFGAAGAVDS